MQVEVLTRVDATARYGGFAPGGVIAITTRRASQTWRGRTGCFGESPHAMPSQKQTTAFEDLIQSERPVLIDFYADWCGPCKAFAPQLAQFKHEMGDKVRVVKIDVDRNPEIAGKLGVQSIPTIMIYQRGEQKYRQAGARPISELRAKVEELAR